MKILAAPSWAKGYMWFVRIVFGCALALPMLTYGAVDFEPLTIVALLISLAAFLVCWRPIGNRAIAWIAFIALLCLALVTTVEYFQSLRFPNNPFEHPSWKFVREFIGPVDGSISVSPEQTKSDIIAWAPIFVFVVAFHLFNRTREALFLIKSLCALNVAVTVVSLVQFCFFATSVGFGDKQFYIGSLTGLYVNRNSAGTFFGVGVIISVGLMVFYLQESKDKNLIRRIFLRSGLSSNERAAVYLCVGALLQVLALAATQSRGAEASTFVALLGLIWIFNGRGDRQTRNPKRRSPPSRSASLVRFATIVSVAFIVAVLVGQEAIYRMDAQSVDEARLCTYASTWHAIVDNWPWGAGFGSFQDVFPSYRSADCSGIDGVWDAAHDSYLEGILGLGATFIVVLIVGYCVLIPAFVYGLRNRRSYKFAPAIGVTTLTLISLHSLVDFSMQIPGNALFVAALFSGCVTVSLSKQGRHQ